MKKYLALAATTCIVVALFSRCSKQKSSQAAVKFGMSAAIVKDGYTNLFSASGSQLVTALDSDGNCRIIATGNSGNLISSKFTFVLIGYSGVGTYNFDHSFPSYAVYENMEPAFSQTEFAWCTVTITSTTYQNIIGTFYGALTDGSSVSNGTFTASGRGF